MIELRPKTTLPSCENTSTGWMFLIQCRKGAMIETYGDDVIIFHGAKGIALIANDDSCRVRLACFSASSWLVLETSGSWLITAKNEDNE